MEIHIKKNDSRLFASFFGELDHHNAAEVRTILDEELADASVTELVLDMSGTTFMDSSGLGVVLGRYKTVSERGGRLYIGGASKSVERILKMAGVYALAEKTDLRGGI